MRDVILFLLSIGILYNSFNIAILIKRADLFDEAIDGIIDILKAFAELERSRDE